MVDSKQSHAKSNIPYAFAKQHWLLVTKIENDVATVFYTAKTPTEAINEVRRHSGYRLNLEKISIEDFANRLESDYHSTTTAEQLAGDIGEETDLMQMVEDLPTPEDLLESEDDAPIIRLLNALLTQAIKMQASDIHLETFEDHMTVRFRVDGVLQEILQPQRVLASLLVSRIKVMAKLDIAEKRLPQDGRIGLLIAGRSIDVRVSTMPASHGERVVLRLLDKKSANLDLTHLGMAPDLSERLRKLIKRPHGIILMTGPTGAGKTTTLYAILSELNETRRNILTVEDPIEYYLPGIGQTQVNAKVNMTFARGLRAILRQDPDVVMVGEIRDIETAEIAVQASLTGHLVLSTLHTNTAIGALTRLADMGVEPFLLSSSLIGVAAQRLVRLLCNTCKEKHVTTPDECKALQLKDNTFIYRPKGCSDCNHIGYKGRTGIYELIPIDKTLQNLIHQRKSEQELSAYAHELYPPLFEDGKRLVMAGKTALEEIMRVTCED